jgi:hypothetical protein
VNEYRIIIAGIAALSLSACAAESTEPKPPEPRVRPEVTKQAQPDMPDGHPDVSPLAVMSRGPRRLSVDQLERSIETIGQLAQGTVVLDASLAQALGRPDYLRVTEESLEPSPLFMKFMMDLAGYACTGLSDADPMRPLEERVLTRFSDREENIRYLLVRFAGLEGAPADPYVPRLWGTFEQGAQGARGERGGWEAVCIALFTSPEFLLY